MEENIIQNEQENESCTIYELEKCKFEIEKRDNIFAILSIISSIIASAFGIWGGFRGGFTVSSILMLGTFTVYLANKEFKIKLFPLVCMILSVGISLSYTITSNGSVLFWSTVVLALLNMVWYTFLVSNQRESGDLGLLRIIFKPLLQGIFINMSVSLKSLISGNVKNSKKLGMSVLGILISIPFLTVIIPLLMSSDEAFSGMANMFSDNILTAILKIIFGRIIAIFVIPYGFTLKKEEQNESERVKFKGIENSLLISFLSVISVCYLAYLFSQLAYFFSAFSGFLPKDYNFTLSAYARRGFFEMSVIAAINFVIIFAAVLISRKKEGKLCVSLKALCTFIGFFTLIIIATALSKMVLYIGNYGMTILRITTSAFMVFLAVVFISLMLRVFIPKIKVIRTGLVTAATVLIILGTVNVNYVVADYNFNAYRTKILNEIDVQTIYELGEEGIPYLIKLTGARDPEVNMEAKERILDSITAMYETEYNDSGSVRTYSVTEKKYDGLGEQSIPRSRAYNILDKYMEKNPDILEREIYTEYAEIYY